LARGEAGGHAHQPLRHWRRIRADIDDAGTKRSVYAWVSTAAASAANPLRQHMGLGKASRVERLKSSGDAKKTQEIKGLAVGQFIEFTEVRRASRVTL